MCLFPSPKYAQLYIMAGMLLRTKLLGKGVVVMLPLFFFLKSDSFVESTTCTSLQRSAARKRRLDIGGNARKQVPISHLLTYKLSRNISNHMGGNCQKSRKNLQLNLAVKTGVILAF